ncbi:SDR family oxidoreductase [Cnuibacter physcomitrellae]|uniref:SDR family NAD(P)-dependent oxidoreductase n=1 Tax=Cnuibacter physcomitrellae TaxID=1619308 RepID=UPI002175903C|nr:SDR family oxidoreductase [Cnuibacter physcomitrellae]MCS5498253.1 SDR family oxidoreductase [Cnuibacter physcomitrellae]
MTRRAIVVGALGGIGRATVARLAEDGIEVHAVDRLPEVVETPPVGATRGHSCDVTDPSAVAATCAAVLAGGSVSILVNAAAVISTGDAEACTLDDFDRTMSVNVRGPWLFAREVLPGMRDARDGVIVNLTSTAGLRPSQNRLAYSTSKAAIRQLTRSIATDYGRFGVRANVVCPGPIDTELWRATRPEGMSADDHLQVTTAGLALPRLGTTEEIASMIGYLVSDQATYITGATFTVDGGRTLH